MRSVASCPIVELKLYLLIELTRIVQVLDADFNANMMSKQRQYEELRARVQAVTREVAEHRQQIRQLRSQVAELENIRHRTTNLEAALAVGVGILWGSGRLVLADRTELNRSPRPVILMDDKSDSPLPVASSASLPSDNSGETLVLLRRIKAWQSRIDAVLTERMVELRERNAEKELQCRQVVSICADVPLEKVDDVSVRLKNDAAYI